MKYSLLFSLCALIQCTYAAVPPLSSYNLYWTSPSLEPGNSEDGKSTFLGAMPIGNGDLTSLFGAWNVPNTTTGGVQLFLTKSDSFSENSELFKIAQIQIMLTPNPFQNSNYFNQTLDFQSASITLAGGGTNSSPAVIITAYVDANNDVVTVEISSPMNIQYTVDIYLTSTLPSILTSYSVPFFCDVFPTLPDTIVSTVPGNTGYQTDSLIIYHVNNISHSIIQQTLQQQGVPSIYNSIKDWFAGRIYGLVVDHGNGIPYNRIAPNHLQSTSPGSSFTVRITALSEIPNSGSNEFLTDLGSLVNQLPNDNTRWNNHLQYWNSFWSRSYIFINASTSSINEAYNYYNNNDDYDLYQEAEQAGAAAAFSTSSSISSETRQVAKDTLEANLPSNMALWLKADAITGVNDGSSINIWKDSSGNGNDGTQTNTSAAALPIYYSQGWNNNMPSVRFNGAGSFLQNIKFQLNSQSSIFAVFNDTGSTTVCCSGVFYAKGTNNGIGTAHNPPTAHMDDDDAPIDNQINSIMVDYAGSDQLGTHNVLNRGVVGTVVYSATTSNGYVDGCLETSTDAHGGPNTAYQVGTRNNEMGRYFNGDIVEIIVYNTALNDTDRQAVEAYLASKWNIKPKHCKTPPSNAYRISQQWISTRYMQAIQSRNTVWPIKFNGQMFVATLPDGTMNANYRDWGASNWWQNTRLQYGGMLATGDFDTFEPILEYYLNTLTFAQERTQLYFNHSGIYYTETKTIWGAYAPQDYGCSRPPNYPVWLETNDYIHLDYGGDGGTPEVALMALDYFLYTNDTTKLQRYLPLALSTADFFREHYANRSSDGTIMIYPTQVLETYWCDWNTTSNGPTNCCTNDLPTIAGLHTLVEKLLALPPNSLTPQQITEIQQFQTILPPIPMENNMLVAAEILSSGTHNSEFCTGYAMHPYRQYTVGRNITQNLDLDPAIRAFEADPEAMGNTGWNQGIMDSALLGLTSIASKMLLDRATGPSAPGYRYLSFTPHYQDYEPSANHLANFLTGLNLMLLQPIDGSNVYSDGNFVVFPAWPCEWDVSFQLYGGLNTTITIDYSNGQLNSFVVNPPERKSNFIFANCVTN